MYKAEVRERNLLECGKKDHMIKDCPICKKKLAAKKPGQKHPFGHSTHQENIGNDDSRAKKSNGGEAEEENTEDAEEDSHFGKRDE